MKLEDLGEMELRYSSLESLDYGAGGQIYGVVEGAVRGDRLRGTLHLTNLAVRRPDNVNLPALRGLLTTDDGVAVWVEMDGIAVLRASDKARVFVTSFRCRTGDPRYEWLNTTFVLVEGVLDRAAVGGTARCRLYYCEATV